MTSKVFLRILLAFFLGFSQAFGQATEKVGPGIISIKESLQFYVFGDWGRKGQNLLNRDAIKNQEALSIAMDQVGNVIKPVFIISTGDNFYPNGVQTVSDPRWKETFEDIYRGANLHCRWYVVLGNHDHHGKVQAEIDYTQLDTARWTLPANYYSKVMITPDGGRIKFIFIDTTPFVNGSDAPQLKWLKNELEENTFDWKFVVGHHPLYSGNYRTGEQLNLRDAIEKLLIVNNVNAYFCGHDHNLQYLKNGTINYFISGAGSEIYQSKPIDNLTQYIYCKEQMNCTSAFMAFSLTKSVMTVQMIDSKGRLLYKTNVVR